MGYGRTIVADWPKREWLAVAVIAITASFLVGATVTLAATNGEITRTTADLDRNATVEYVSGPDEPDAGGRSVVLPVTRVGDDARGSRVVVGVPSGEPSLVEGASYAWAEAGLPRPPADGRLAGDVDATRQRRVDAPSGRRTLTVEPSSSASILPPRWYVASVGTVHDLGRTGSLVIRPRPGSAAADDDLSRAHLSSAGAYLRRGAGELIDLLWVLTAVEGVIIGVVVYAITKQSVLNRSTTIFAIRSTGGTRRIVLRLFALRAGVRTAVGVALGTALGLALAGAAALVTGRLGRGPVAALTARDGTLWLLVPALSALVLLGGATGYAAARTAVSETPGRALDRSNRPRSAALADRLPVPDRLRAAAATDLLSWRTLVPTTATLAVFVCVVLLVSSASATLAPLTSASDRAVVDADAPHPLASQVDAGYAAEIRERGGAASPEILVPEVVGGRPFLARGANYDAFASVSGARLTEGRRPNGSTEAVVGSDLARTLGVGVGDRLVLGGSTVPAVTRVTVVGAYAGSGLTDDQLIVSLRTARHLSVVSAGNVNLIRTEGAPRSAFPADSSTGSAGESAAGVVVRNYSVPRRMVAGERGNASVRLVNRGETERSHSLSIRLGSFSERRNVTLGPNESRTVRMPLRAPEPGEHRLRFERLERNLTVVPPGTVRLASVPSRAPPNATLVVRAVDENDRPVPNATVALAGRTARTDEDGAARLPVPGRPGSLDLSVAAPDRAPSSYDLRVDPGAPRTLSADLRMPTPTVEGRSSPVARVELTNPWNRTLTRTIAFRTENGTTTKRTTLAPGERTTVDARLPSPPDGSGSLAVRSDGERTLATGSYVVVDPSGGLERYGQGNGVGLSGSIGRVIGSLVHLQAALVLFAGVTVLGSTSIVFAQAIRVRRRSIGIHRATGMPPRRVVGLVVSDALKIGAVAAALALGIGTAGVRLLSEVGALTAFGVRIDTWAPPWLVAGIAIACVALVAVSAGVAGVRNALVDPAPQSASGPE